MSRYIIKRILMIIPIILIVSILIFTIMYFVPGDPARVILGANATEVQLAQKRAEMGLDQPYIVQLGSYLYRMFFQLDLGTSYIYNTSVSAEIIGRLPRTLLFAFMCMVLSAVIGIPLGMSAATHQDGIIDRASMSFSLIGISLPNFWVALILVIIFSLKLGILPAYGVGGIEYYILPCIAGALGGVAQVARLTRSSMLEVIRSDHIATARAKGVSERGILWRHIFPNGVVPVIQILGNIFGDSLAGAIVIENVFVMPGLGTYLTTAITNRDYPVVRGVVVVLGLAFCIIMLLVDLAFAFADPRIKAQYEGQSRRRRRKENG